MSATRVICCRRAVSKQLIAISAEDLEFKPGKCLEAMLIAEKNDWIVNLSKVACQRNWQSNFVSSMAMLVGTLSFNPIFPFYGYDSAIDDELGLKLLQVAIRLGANVQSVDGVGQTPMDLLKTGLMTSRNNNAQFKRYLVSAVVAEKTVAMIISSVAAACSAQPNTFTRSGAGVLCRIDIT